jgi:hypothetical protein
VNYAKVAAVVAGSAMAAGVAAPAVAAEAMPVPTSLTGAVNSLPKVPVNTPLKQNSLDTQKAGSLANNATRAVGQLNRGVKRGAAAELLGGLPLGR